MQTSVFYTFTAIHSFLIGLFPFYIPVYLYGSGVSLSIISLFISATGAGYCLFLFILDRLLKTIPLSRLICWSFVSEVVMLALLFAAIEISWFLPLAGIANGIFACCFWTIQRLLFVYSVNSTNSGHHFGNLQILVMLVLKVAILLGGFLLEQGNETALLLCSAFIAGPAILYYSTSRGILEAGKEIAATPPLSLPDIVRFKDACNSRPVFVVDGIFLYLESYFWLVSLFIVVSEDFSNLGLLTVVLTLLFGVLFFLIKNRIDSYPANKLYTVSVILYAFSWLLRAAHHRFDSQSAMLISLAVIAFCTSLFRLHFNKRFFDNARQTVACHHILVKSYISQFCLAVFFAGTALSFTLSTRSEHQLSLLYTVAAITTPLFLFYRTQNTSSG